MLRPWLDHGMVTPKNIASSLQLSQFKNLIWLPECTQSNHLKIQPWYKMSIRVKGDIRTMWCLEQKMMRANNKEMAVLKRKTIFQNITWLTQENIIIPHWSWESDKEPYLFPERWTDFERVAVSMAHHLSEHMHDSTGHPSFQTL
jgi:hypothetical protein